MMHTTVYGVITGEVYVNGVHVATYVDAATDGPVGAHINRALPSSCRRAAMMERAMRRFGGDIEMVYSAQEWGDY